MGVKGLLLSPAADGPKEGTGHHHIIVEGNGLKARAGWPCFCEQV